MAGWIISVGMSNQKKAAEQPRNQGYLARSEELTLRTWTVGALPLINRILDRMRLESFFEQHLPPDGPTMQIPARCGPLLLVRNILLSREPIYGLGEWAQRHAPDLIGIPTLGITWGHNKDHRPDLKQLLYILTVTNDGGVPIYFTSASGNTPDDTTHLETWEMMRELVGSSDFLYVADCKLASTSNPPSDRLTRRPVRHGPATHTARRQRFPQPPDRITRIDSLERSLRDQRRRGQCPGPTPRGRPERMHLGWLSVVVVF